MTKAELESLRKEMERIDAKIIELVIQRSQASYEIGLVKKKDGLPVRDRSRERQVKEVYARTARQHGFDPGVAVKLAELLMADSVKTQTQKNKRDLVGKKALVVGGSGRMGEWFCRRLSNRGAAVKVWDPRGRLLGYENTSDLRPAVRESDIIVVSSPLGMAKSELKIVLNARPKGLVFDVCSVKSHIANQLRTAARAGINVASIHPMFGPNVPTPFGRTIIVCDCGSSKGTAQAVKLISGAGAKVIRLSLEEHDKLMAYVLGLPHLTSLAFAATLAGSDVPLTALIHAKGPSFERLLAASRELSKESVRVYHDIQSLNPNTKAMFTDFINSVNFLKRASIKKAPAEFRKIMESNRKYLEVR